MFNRLERRSFGFIGEHGVAGGQLCLNVASILSGRLVEGNKKVLEMGKELQASLLQLKSASGPGAGKGNQALQKMQGKVANMQNAFKGGAVKKSNNIFAISRTLAPFSFCLTPEITNSCMLPSEKGIS